MASRRKAPARRSGGGHSARASASMSVTGAKVGNLIGSLITVNVGGRGRGGGGGLVGRIRKGAAGLARGLQQARAQAPGGGSDGGLADPQLENPLDEQDQHYVCPECGGGAVDCGSCGGVGYGKGKR